MLLSFEFLIPVTPRQKNAPLEKEDQFKMHWQLDHGVQNKGSVWVRPTRKPLIVSKELLHKL